MIFLFFSLFEA